MNQADMLKLARINLDEKIHNREVQIEAKLESIEYRLNRHVHGIDGIDVSSAKVLMDDLVLLYADYEDAKKRRSELGD